MRLTEPQREALEVLYDMAPPIGGWKRRTQREPIPRINYLAGASLVMKGLAREEFPMYGSGTCFDGTFTITSAGRAALGAGDDG